jgi:two-component system sensor histidine kinase YesM
MSRLKLEPGSLRDKVILIFFAILVLPFLIFAYYSHMKAVNGISNANNITSFSYLMQARSNFESYLTGLNGQMNELIGDKELQSLLEKPPANRDEEDSFIVNMLTLMNQRSSTIDVFRIHLYPAYPEHYPSYMNTVDESERVVHQDWFNEIRDSGTPRWELSMPTHGQYAKPLLLYIKRFTGLYDNVPRGIIVADVSEDQLGRFFNPPNLIKGQKILLLDEDRNVIYDSSSNQWTGNPGMPKKFEELMVGNTKQAQDITIGGEKYLVSSLKLDSKPWYVVNLSPFSQLTGSIEEIKRLMIVFLVVYLICCFGVVFYLTANFTQPIVKLVQLMRRAERGQFRHPILNSWSKRSDEVGWLYQGFDSLTTQIERLVEEAARSELKKRELEFQVLSHQINPHFLYNTLESIRWKAESHGRSDISEMVAALGNLLRLSLNQGKEITTLRREIEQVKAYVQIEQARMGETIRIVYLIDPELQSLSILRLLLQPLVENAIHHSIRDNFEHGKIIISVQQEKQDLLIEIMDNGKGIPQEVLDKLNQDIGGELKQSTDTKGVGLRNVNERLRLYFGEAYRLSIDSGPTFGTRIVLRHPVITEQDQRFAQNK